MAHVSQNDLFFSMQQQSKLCPIIRKSKSQAFVLQLVPRFPHREQLVCLHVWGSRGYLIYRFTGVLRATVVEINEYRSHVLMVEREREGARPPLQTCDGVCVCVFSRNSFGLCDPGLASSDTGNGGRCYRKDALNAVTGVETTHSLHLIALLPRERNREKEREVFAQDETQSEILKQ